MTARTESRTDILRELHDGCYRRLLGQLCAFTGDLGEAQDAVQQAFVRALAAPQPPDRLDDLEACLRLAALDIARRRVRRVRRRARLAALRRLRRPHTPAAAGPDLSPDCVAVLAALRRLPAAQAEAVALHHLAGLPVAEVAFVTGVAAGRVAVRLSRGRARLDTLLATGDAGQRLGLHPTPEQRLADLREAVRAEVEPVALAGRVPFARLVEAASRRRQRRRRTTAVALLAAAGVALVLVSPWSRHSAPPVTNRHPTGRSSTLLVQSLVFGTADHGFATVVRCAGPGYRCAAHAQLLRTDDGARTWTPVPSPAANGPGEQCGVDTVTETGGVVLRVGSIRYASPDGGGHWSVVPDTSPRGPAVDAAPPGWRLVLDASGRVVAFDPLTNTQRPLTDQPAAPARLDDGWVQDTAGHRTVLARTTGRHLVLAYTDDRGRTWHAMPAPPGQPGTGNRLLADPATERIYLATGDDRWRLLRVWRLDRVGAGWVRVPVPPTVTADPNPGVMMILQMLPDGELAYLISPPLRTEGGGTRAVPMPDVGVYGIAATLDDLGVSAGGTLYHILPATIIAPSGVLAVLVSTDSGRTWTTRQSRL